MSKILFLSALAASAAAIYVAGPPVTAQEVNPAQTEEWVSIPPADFTPFHDHYDFVRTNGLYSNSGSQVHWAPINLPEGAQIKKIALICIDDSDADNIELQIRRMKKDLSYSTVATVSSTGADSAARTFASIITPKIYINNWKFSYYLRLVLPGTKLAGYVFGETKLRVIFP